MPRPMCEAMQRVLARAAPALMVMAGAVWLSPAMAQLDMDDIALEGQLRFLDQRPDPLAYRYEATAYIDALSLQTGVVRLHTCHYQLDPNRRVVVVFNPDRVRHMEVLESSGIERAWVEGHQLEMKNVQRGGHVCVALHSKALEPAGDGRWQLHAGPLMRRYLDGYLPMDAKLAVQWPLGLMTVEHTQPTPQAGVRLHQDGQGATLDITFAGRLTAIWGLKQIAARP